MPGQLYHSPAVWLCLLITIIGALLPDFVLRTFRDNKDVLEDPKMHKVVSEMSWSEVSLSTHSATSLPKKTLEPRQSERHENLTPSWVPSPSTPSGCNTPRRHILHTKATLVGLILCFHLIVKIFMYLFRCPFISTVCQHYIMWRFYCELHIVPI